MRKIFDNFIKVTIINKFGGDKRIEVASGEQSEGVVVVSSPLEAKAIDLSTKLTNKQPKQLKPHKNDKII